MKISNREVLNITKIKEDILILTCKLGNEIINCYDGTHNKEQLKKWASKRILLCPVCGKPYEYCHGEVKTPYFRHMDKNECEDKYSESETEEHLNGKRDLFEWIKKQNGVTEAVLEGWIPETKQRPDIMFKYNGKKYVIEYQCSPIATEYVERHELYKASGIIDIWICGIEKFLQKNMRQKYLQDMSYGFYSYEDKNLISLDYNYYFRRTTLTQKIYKHSEETFCGLSLNDFAFNEEIYNYHFGRLNDIEEKIKYRRSLKEKKSLKIIPKRHNKYLKIQNNKLHKNIKHYLYQLSNSNWHFDLITLNKNDVIIVEPIPHGTYGILSNPDFLNYKLKHYTTISISDMDYESFKKCGRDIDFLKKTLVPIMIENKKQILNYKNEHTRIMEVRDN